MTPPPTNAPKQWFNSDGTRRRGTVLPTRLRLFHDTRGHAAPTSGVDRTGAPWQGASRIIDRPARRKANRASWRKAIAKAARA